MTTHTPYMYVKPNDWQIYREPQSMAQHFLNNMRYLDNCIREYVAQLGAPATILIFGDHPADPALIGSDFEPHWHDGREFIPCFIYDTACNLGDLQRTKTSGLAEDGSLTLLDISTYLRSQVKGTFGPGHAEVMARTAHTRS